MLEPDRIIAYIGLVYVWIKKPLLHYFYCNNNMLFMFFLMLQHTGDLGNITANEEGRAIFYLKDKSINVSHLIGRSVGVTEHEDSCSKAKINKSKIEENNEKA